MTPPQPTPRPPRFRRPANAINLDADQRRRQADVAGAAWAALGSREAVMAFFNEHDEELGGRPLDIAVGSDAGLEQVRGRLARLDPQG